MFGFVNVFKNELKIRDYNLFRAYYCGLCKALGKRYNQLVRLGLSYDMTFLAILADSLTDDTPVLRDEGCIKHIGKHTICFDNSAIDYSADVSIILTYHKICDDISDERSIKAFLAKIPYAFAYKKACIKYPQVASNVKGSLKSLAALEKERCPHIDIAADPFASLTAFIFATFDASLESIGYNVGRFIYIADAYKDINSDIRQGTYNPFVCAHSKDYLATDEFKNQIKASLNMTLAAISQSYSKIKINKNKEILDNIIYMGLRFAYDNLFKESGGNK